MDENRFEGAGRDFAGKVQDAVGGLTGDAALQGRGKVNQAVGQAQSTYGQVMDEVKSFAQNQPFAALFTATGVGLVLGVWLSRR